MVHCIENERVEAIVISLEQQLSVVYPEGLGFLDNTNGSEKEKEQFRCALENTIAGSAYQSDVDEFQKAMKMAVQNWKRKSSEMEISATAEGDVTEKTSAPTSVSLFDQLQGGFAMPVTFEQIEEASSSEERLKVFQKINYLDDFLMDWNRIAPLMVNDLVESHSVNPALCLQLIDLHREWFHKGRSSMEYTHLLFGLCENLLRALDKITSSKAEREVVESLVRNWRDMWLDLMQRDQYSEDLAGSIEKLMLELFLVNPSSELSRDAYSSLEQARHVLNMEDHNAKWFQSWANHVPWSYLVSLLCESERNGKLLPRLWSSAQGDDQSLVILSIIFCRTRLWHFPLTALTNSKRRKDPETAIETYWMLEWLLNRVVSFSTYSCVHPDADDIRIPLLDGIEAILSGSLLDTDGYRRRKVKAKLQKVDNHGIVAQFLETHFKQ